MVRWGRQNAAGSVAAQRRKRVEDEEEEEDEDDSLLADGRITGGRIARKAKRLPRFFP
jgi:hypothetical protein